MLRKSGFEIAGELELPIDPENEPKEPRFLQNTAWVQHHDHQKALLESFAAPLVEQSSLVLFYATRTPLCDDERRVILGAAILEKKHPISEYEYDPPSAPAQGKLRAMVWERAIQHSLRSRKDKSGALVYTGGFVLPYHELQRAAAINPEIDPSEFIAFAPEDARSQFSYGSEQVGHGAAAAALLAAKVSLEKLPTALDGPWADQIAWIDGQLSRLWKLQGPAPGLGVVLSALHQGFNGTLFAIAISDLLKPNEDPWPLVNEILSGSRKAPPGAPSVTATLRRRWEKVRSDEARLDLLKLLARIELTKTQALRAIVKYQPKDLLANLYVLFESERGVEEDPIAFHTIDRAILPGTVISEAHKLPASSNQALSEPDNPHRLRAGTVYLLEEKSEEGHTIVNSKRLSEAAAELTLTRPLPIDGELLDLFRSDLVPLVRIGEGENDPTAQLDRYVASKILIERAVGDRIASSNKTVAAEWVKALNRKFGSVAADDETEARARSEKVSALQRLATSRIAVLIGPAGTGKTAVLELILERLEIVGRQVLLLAPTGKARVRLGAETGRPGEAQTVAQFLLALERYDGSTGRYFTNAKAAQATATCCIIDESSMLTEDMLAAIIDALPPSCRLILVGDPYQLPPIGAGCPFVDIASYLQAHRPDAVAELTVSRRQQGPDRADSQLAAIFSGRGQPAGEDEIAARALQGFEDKFLKLRRWEKTGELSGLLREIFCNEFQCPNQTEDLVSGLEQALGAKRHEKGYWNFGSGCSTQAEAWQILAVNRNLAVGSAYLNRSIKENYRSQRLQTAVASNNVSWKRKWFRFTKPQGPEQIVYGDKVICVRNHKREPYHYGRSGGDNEKEYLANGEIGLVTGATAYGHSNPKYVNVEFTGRPDRSFGFPRSAFVEDGQPFLELAYAVTVHKAQGSQFGTVILILPANSRLLSREMLYTALTRQTDRIWILHQGGFEQVLAYRHDVFSDIGARTTNLLHDTRPEPVVLPIGLPPGAAKNARGFLEDRLTHRTIRGECVSSKSELAIANILHEMERRGKLTYEVEPPLPFTDNARGRWADFRIFVDGNIWYWEHCGLLDRPAYRNRWQAKEKLYQENGFERWSATNPSGRLIVTEDGPDRGLDSHLIHGIAAHLFEGA